MAPLSFKQLSAPRLPSACRWKWDRRIPGSGSPPANQRLQATHRSRGHEHESSSLLTRIAGLFALGGAVAGGACVRAEAAAEAPRRYRQ